MADTPALGAGTRKGMEVQVLSWAPNKRQYVGIVALLFELFLPFDCSNK